MKMSTAKLRQRRRDAGSALLCLYASPNGFRVDAAVAPFYLHAAALGGAYDMAGTEELPAAAVMVLHLLHRPRLPLLRDGAAAPHPLSAAALDGAVAWVRLALRAAGVRLPPHADPVGTAGSDGAAGDCESTTLRDLPCRTLLHHACLGGHVEMVKWLVQLNIDDVVPKSAPRDPASGATPAHFAALGGSLQALRFAHVAWPEATADCSVDNGGATVLHCAAASGNTELVRVCLSLWPGGDEFRTPVVDVCGVGPTGHGAAALPVVRATLGDPARPNAVHHTSRRYSPLCVAAARGHTNVCAMLQSAGADVRFRTSNARSDGGKSRTYPTLPSRHRKVAGLTPLHFAAAGGFAETVKHFLATGADPDAVDSEGMSPLHFAAAGGHVAAFLELLHAPAGDTARASVPPTGTASAAPAGASAAAPPEPVARGDDAAAAAAPLVVPWSVAPPSHWAAGVPPPPAPEAVQRWRLARFGNEGTTTTPLLLCARYGPHPALVASVDPSLFTATDFLGGFFATLRVAVKAPPMLSDVLTPVVAGRRRRWVATVGRGTPTVGVGVCDGRLVHFDDGGADPHVGAIRAFLHHFRQVSCPARATDTDPSGHNCLEVLALAGGSDADVDVAVSPPPRVSKDAGPSEVWRSLRVATVCRVLLSETSCPLAAIRQSAVESVDVLAVKEGNLAVFGVVARLPPLEVFADFAGRGLDPDAIDTPAKVEAEVTSFQTARKRHCIDLAVAAEGDEAMRRLSVIVPAFGPPTDEYKRLLWKRMVGAGPLLRSLPESSKAVIAYLGLKP